ncbi:unnamed protein product [Pelagomonas calceolata]|uniref:Glutathione-disulfide reductase n=1 Tax=Pelagomonas calceolata TaxID=35677 RepID=A0A7S3ZRK9_9STRA|nr:unnamed protein product [Pelagomonas calceolata]
MASRAHRLVRRLSSAASSYDALVIGGGPVGTEIARLGGLIGLDVAVVDPRGALLAAPTGYVSKVLLDVSNCAERNSRVVPREWTHAKYALDATAVRALAMTADLFQDSSVGADVVAGRTEFAPTVIQGRAAFKGRDASGSYEVQVHGAAPTVVHAPTVFIATGSASTRLPSLPFDEANATGWIFDSDSIVGIGRVPEHIFIQGGGLIAVEYAFIFERLGAKVTLALREERVLQGKDVDIDISAAVGARLEERGVEIRYGDGNVVKVTPPAEHGGVGSVELGSGTVVEAGAFLSALGRGGAAKGLNVENAGLRPPLPSGHLAVDYNSLVAESTGGDCRVFVAGDTVKDCAIYPGGLLSTGLAQGHVAVRGAFPEAWRATFPPVGRRVEGSKMDAFPAVAFWIDDGVATVGVTEQAARMAHGDDIGTASAKYSETVKACVQPRPDDEFLKIVYLKTSGSILGVHIFGKDASEMINHGAAFVNRGQTIWDVIHSIPPAVTYDEVFLRAARRACYSMAQFSGERA